MSKIRIILADDHSVLRTGLKLLLNNEPDMKVVGEASDGEQVLRLLEKERANILILDLSMPNMGGIECIKEIKSRSVAIKVLVLTMYENDDYLVEVMQAGAMGYVEKNALDTELFQAVRTVSKGQRYLSPQKAQVLLQSLLSETRPTQRSNPYTVLTFREREVLKFMARGYSMSQIAQLLCISVKTVDTHKTRMMEKLGFTEKSELVDYALRHGLLAAKNTGE
jgi:two-component system, NarL family, response regulator NreC